MPFRVTPSLGPDLYQVVKAENVWYEGAEQVGSPQLGSTVFSDDGRKAIWVEASGAIAVVAAPGTQVSLTFTGPDDVTAATGSGGYYAGPNTDNYSGTIAEGDRFWALEGNNA